MKLCKIVLSYYEHLCHLKKNQSLNAFFTPENSCSYLLYVRGLKKAGKMKTNSNAPPDVLRGSVHQKILILHGFNESVVV